MTNINDRNLRDAKRAKYLPMVESCVQVAIYQLRRGRHFIIENPQSSALWWQYVFRRIFEHPQVTWGNLDLCAYGMKGPNGYYYYKPTSLLHSFPDGTLDPVFKRCPNKLGGASHTHQQLEGSAPGHGSRTKLAQVYPYRFCSQIIRSLLSYGNLRSLRPAQTLLVEELLTCLTTEELQEVTEDIQHLEQEFVHFSSKTSIPVNEHYLRYVMHMLSGKTEYPPTLVNLQDDVSILRKHFIPTHAFENAVILRGTFLPLRTTYGNKRGALLLWKKKDVSQMYVLVTHSLDLRQLKPNQWTCVFLWNSDGRMPANPDVPQPQQHIEPPPGLPPVDGQPPVDPHTDTPMDPDVNMPGPPLVPDDDPPDELPDQTNPWIRRAIRLASHLMTHIHQIHTLAYHRQMILQPHLLLIFHLLVHILLDHLPQALKFHQHLHHTNLYHNSHNLQHYHFSHFQAMLLFHLLPCHQILLILICIILSNVKHLFLLLHLRRKPKLLLLGIKRLLPPALRLATIWGVMFQYQFHKLHQNQKTTSQNRTIRMKMMRLTHKQDLAQEHLFCRLSMMLQKNQLMYQFLMMIRVIR